MSIEKSVNFLRPVGTILLQPVTGIRAAELSCIPLAIPRGYRSVKNFGLLKSCVCSDKG